MKFRLPRTRLSIHGILAALLCFLWLSGCGPSLGKASVPAQATDPTPTIDMAHARDTLNAKGALTYDEVVALRHEMVGEAPDLQNFGNDLEKYRAAESEYESKLSDFGSRLDKSKLKESLGYIAYWGQETNKDYTPIPGKMRLYVYMSDPYSGGGKNLGGPPDVVLSNISDDQESKLQYGQRIQVSGDFAPDGWPIEVKNSHYSLLDEDMQAAAPTEDELKDLTVVLDRSMCYGTCPDYALTVEPDGKITFVGRNFTGTKGTATATLSKEQLVELARAIKKADFFSLKDEYRASVTDMPTYTLTVQMGGHKKTVVNYAAGPRRIYLLEDIVDQLTDSSQWIKCSPEPCGKQLQP